MRSLLLVSLVMPLASAWSFAGSWEPDTKLDRNDGFMFMLPDTNPAGARVYFNGVVTPLAPSMSPNTGALSSSVLAPGLESPVALLAVWKDCNRDGYVGLAESATLVYRSEVLALPNQNGATPGTSVCYPAAEGDHNDGSWIREVLWIGWPSNAAVPWGVPPGTLADEDARVWADEGRPGDAPAQGCFVNPPTGTFSSTGGLLSYADCGTGRQGADAVNALDPDGGLGLRFEDPESPQCSSSLLNQRIGLFGDDPQCPHPQPGLLEGNTGQPAFTSFDCDREIHRVEEEGSDAPLLVLYGPRPELRDARGSWWDAAGGVLAASRGSCGGPMPAEFDPYHRLLDPEEAVADASAKREATFAFEFLADRGRGVTARLDDVPDGGLTHPPGQSTRQGPGWFAQEAQSSRFPVRSDLSVAGPSYYTFHAFVSSAAIAAYGLEMPVSVGAYGAGACATGIGAGAPVTNGWACDPEEWYSPGDGASEMPRATWSGQEIGIRVGSAFNLRDVDCFDGSTPALRGQGISATMLSQNGSCV